MKQTDRILRHLKDYGKITPKDAMDEYGIMRLAARISDLRKCGHRIASRTVEGKNRYGEKIHYKEYRLENNNGFAQ